MSNTKTKVKHSPQKKVKEILHTLPARNRDVLERRFGFRMGEQETLESIGRQYGITRERVRQIQNNTMNTILKTPAMADLEMFFNLLCDHVSDHGYLRREEKLLNDDAKDIFHEAHHDKYLKPAIFFILSLGDKFSYHSEGDHLHSLWSTNREFIVKAKTFLQSLTKAIEDAEELLSVAQLLEKARPIAEQAGFLSSERAMLSAIDAFKGVDSNIYGDYGLSHWANVRPRGVRDKAYLVLKKHDGPLHFSKISDEISDTFGAEKDAKVQTVHNELIKDDRFVLVGRGLYALSEWGYLPGTVKDILVLVLKETHGPLSKEDLIDKVRKQRFIKDNTILLGLQDRGAFKRTSEGLYELA